MVTPKATARSRTDPGSGPRFSVPSPDRSMILRPPSKPLASNSGRQKAMALEIAVPPRK